MRPTPQLLAVVPHDHRRTRGRPRGFAVLALGFLAGTLLVARPVGAGAQDAGVAGSQLTAVRVGNDGTFDRVVFEFAGTDAPEVVLTGPSVNPGSVPADPSNLPVEVAGTQVITVVMHGAMADWPPANPTGPYYTGPTDIVPSTTANVVQVVKTGDFELVLSWAIGVRVGTTPRLSTFTDPVRIVVDIPHATPVTPSTAAPTSTLPPPVVSVTPQFTG
jgi:hypothetical protein